MYAMKSHRYRNIAIQTDIQTDRQTVIWQGPVVRSEETQVDIQCHTYRDIHIQADAWIYTHRQTDGDLAGTGCM